MSGRAACFWRRGGEREGKGRKNDVAAGIGRTRWRASEWRKRRCRARVGGWLLWKTRRRDVRRGVGPYTIYLILYTTRCTNNDITATNNRRLRFDLQQVAVAAVVIGAPWHGGGVEFRRALFREFSSILQRWFGRATTWRHILDRDLRVRRSLLPPAAVRARIYYLYYVCIHPASPPHQRRFE